jgi:uncharacterized protein (DUF58 family)
MAIVREVPSVPSRLSSLLTTDFCPWANRFVYWLKEPVGWFVLAALASILVGAFLSPVGWTLAAGLASVLAFGIGFPWLATRCVWCRVHPVHGELHEREVSYLQLSIRNYLPLPIMGLMVEGYLTASFAKDETLGLLLDMPEAALERIPAFSTATYRLTISAEYRGCYPKQAPKITCSFPFGIWTARREIGDWGPVTVLPLLIPISEELEFAGDQLSELGVGNRASTHGDFLGVRNFRRGDSLKNIHWAQSARQDQFVVCERGGPQNQAIELHLSTTRCQGTITESRENLAWRVRIASSLVELLSARHLPYRLIVDGSFCGLSDSASGRKLVLQQLAEIPLDGQLVLNEQDHTGMDSQKRSGASWIAISRPSDSVSSQPASCVNVEIGLHSKGLRQRRNNARLIDLDDDITGQLNGWLSETVHV